MIFIVLSKWFAGREGFNDTFDMKCGNYTRKSHSFFSIGCAFKTKVMGKIGFLMLRTLDCEYRSYYICMYVWVISSLLKSGLVGYTANQKLSWSNSGIWLFLEFSSLSNTCSVISQLLSKRYAVSEIIIARPGIEPRNRYSTSQVLPKCESKGAKRKVTS